jgi:enamine deaminase RidA (YjgF/YER057c/UK114 family)
MSRTIVSTAGAPAAIGPYSQAVRVGNVVGLSGRIALDPASGHRVEGFGARSEVDATVVRA